MSTTRTIPIVLKAGGVRTIVVTVEEAQRILARFQATIQKMKRRFSKSSSNDNVNVVVKKMDLSCRVWPPAAFTILLPFLTSIAPTLEILKCDDVIASLPTEDGLQTLQLLSDVFSTEQCPVVQLQEVNFNDNALGTRGLQRLAPLLSRTSIVRVYLENCGISGEAARETLSVCLHNRPLTHVALGLNQMGEAGAICLGEILVSSQLEYLSYKGSRPLSKGTRGLLQGLVAADTSHLLHLDLNDADLKSSLELMCQVLEKSPHVTQLILRDSALTKRGLSAVLQALYKSRARLVHLDLGAMFGDDDDDDNDGDDDEETKHVESAMELGRFLATQWQTLQVLILGDTEWHNAAILALILESGPLFTCPERCVLRTLNLEACLLSGSDVLAVLADNPIPTLQELILMDNGELTAGAALQMLQNEVYSTDIVKVDDELDQEEDEEEDDDVNALVGQLAQGAHIAD